MCLLSLFCFFWNQGPTVNLVDGGQGWISKDYPLQLNVSNSTEGHWAFLVQQIDISDQFIQSDSLFTFQPASLGLPPGETELVCYFAQADSWQEVARFPLKVLTPRGFKQADVQPNLEVTVLHGLDRTGQFNQNEETQISGRGLITSQHSWADQELKIQVQVQGESVQAKALRFSELADDAPQIDLVDYQIHYQNGGFFTELGHLNFGNHRHLMQVFNQRGFQLGYQRERIQLALTNVYATPIAGYNHFFGWQDGHHIQAASLGFELLARKGGLRLDLLGLRGEKSETPAFDVGEVRESEKNQGYGIMIQATNPNNRIRMKGTWSQSRYENPATPFWQNTIEPAQTKQAYWVQAQGDLLQGHMLANQPFSLSVETSFEQVDPLYRSLASFTQSDRRTVQASLQTVWGLFSWQNRYQKIRDNLDDIPSILTTHTRRWDSQLSLPIRDLWLQKAFMPNLMVGWQQTHQFGAEIPINGDFNQSHIPDQVLGQFQWGLQWQGAKWSAGYQYNGDSTDNRQLGREQADFQNAVHNFNLTLFPNPKFQLSLNATRGRSRNDELMSHDTTQNYGSQWQWTIRPWLSWTGQFQTNRQENPNEGSLTCFESGMSQISSQIQRSHWRFQLYLQYQIQKNEQNNPQFGLAFENEDRQWTLGLTTTYQ
ncbi:MAG: hypothetical protein KDC71_11635 [Acidobacteria bacterium]|nr:hypothetical protein [Acidobacteriota bacterium]